MTLLVAASGLPESPEPCLNAKFTGDHAMQRALLGLAALGAVLIVAGCATAPRVVGSGGSDSGGAAAASYEVMKF